MNRRGMTLLEVVFAAGISLAVLAIGFRAYTSVTRIDDVENRREAVNLAVQDAMNKIKQDVRAGRSVSGSRGVLTISGSAGKVIYRNVHGSSLERKTPQARRTFRGATAEFAFVVSDGVHVTVRAADSVHRRPIRVEIKSFVRPRN